MKLHELSPKEGSTKEKFRKGRGPGSGNGKTAGKGHKGQNARSGGGVRPGFEGGQLPLYRKLPKRGFNNARFGMKYSVVNVQSLNKFNDGEVVDCAALLAMGVIDAANDGVKILGGYDAPQRFGPPEACYATEPTQLFPAVAVRPVGSGMTVSVPWYPGLCYYEEGLDVWNLFMTDVLALCGCRSIAPGASPMVEITLGHKGDTTLIQFVNGTGHFGKSYFDPVPVFDTKVSIPWSRETFRVRDIETEDNAEAVLKDGTLTVTLRRLDAYACIAVQE